MVRGSKKEVNATATKQRDPDVEERLRLKKLALSKNVLSSIPPKLSPSTALGPSKTVIKHHGRDIIRKSQRKNRYLFSFPGLIAPVTGGKIGELKDLGTKNPVLYLDFPQGQMKLFGTIVYPKNRYLTLQFSKGGKQVTCDDYFEHMIVFSEAWWIGTKDENPGELQLPFPKEMHLEKNTEYDFKGGAGATHDKKLETARSTTKDLERESPDVTLIDDLEESQSDHKEQAEATPSRRSATTAGRTLNFAEVSSGDDSMEHGAETPTEEDEKIDADRESSLDAVPAVDEDNAKKFHNSAESKQNAKAMEASKPVRTSLVQKTLSSLFNKAVEKKDSKLKISSVTKEQKKENVTTEHVDSVTIYKRKPKSKPASSSKKGQPDTVSASQSSDPIDLSPVEEDDIEDFSSTPQDMDASDEDWTS